MVYRRSLSAIALVAVALCAALCWNNSTHAADSQAPLLKLEKGDHVCIIGNTLAERMQHHGWLETLIHSRFPENELVFRNLSEAGDELTQRLRVEGFGSPDEHLAIHKADVIFAFFGFNESFKGPKGLGKFKKDLDTVITGMLGHQYNGKSAPRIVMFSPIAQEKTSDPNWPNNADENNQNIKLYSDAMAEAAKAHHVIYVDLFTPSQALYAKASKPLTIDAIHLNEEGDKEVAGAIDAALFGQTSAKHEDASLEKLREAVLDKNFYWFNRYQTVDGYNVYGGRSHEKYAEGITNRTVMDREMEVLDIMTANRDKRIWAVAQGKDLKMDDSNTPPFIPVKTNHPGPGPNGSNVFLDPEEAISHMKVAEGMKVNLVASEKEFPDLAKPVQMAWDTKGRLFVAVMPSYPHWLPKEEMNDKILILEDTKGTGKADKCMVYADHLNCPTGLEFYKGGLLVGQAPDILYLKDTTGGDKVNFRERVVEGVGVADTHHAVNSFTLDPGGALYMQEGTFDATHVETAWGPQYCMNAGVFRYEPRTSKFDVYINHGFANPHGHVFDRWGEDFVTDGTGNVNYFAAPMAVHMDYPQKHPGAKPIFKQRTRPCGGTERLTSGNFPDELQGNYLVANVIGFQGILQYKIDEKDSGYVGTEVQPIVYSDDPNFRPVDIKIGPDGAIYFIDWQNPIIGHLQHHLRDPNRDHTHGRIYRITYTGRPLLTPAKIAGEPIDKLLDLLKAKEDRVRYRAKIELGDRDSKQVTSAVDKWVAALDKNDPEYQHNLMEALWVYQYHNVVNEPLLKQMLRSPDYHARAAATRVLCAWRDRISNVLDLLRVQANDDHPRVRLEAVRTCSFFKTSKAAEVALESLNKPQDDYLKVCLDQTLKTLDKYKD